ncbi:MAG: hypothetical protein ACR2HO_05270 [Rubrobacteraceae bacterium]
MAGWMSIRDQERRQREVERRIDDRMRRADRDVRQRIEQRANAASRRSEQVRRRIERGDVEPRPLPGMREDSLESMPSMKSLPSMEPMPSMESADYKSEVTEEEAEAGMMQDMPLHGIMPYDPASAEEDLAQRVTEETGSGGDPHAHNERKADEISQQLTEDTGAGGDMNEHAERKVDQMGQEMFEE